MPTPIDEMVDAYNAGATLPPRRRGVTPRVTTIDEMVDSYNEANPIPEPRTVTMQPTSAPAGVPGLVPRAIDYAQGAAADFAKTAPLKVYDAARTVGDFIGDIPANGPALVDPVEVDPYGQMDRSIQAAQQSAEIQRLLSPEGQQEAADHYRTRGLLEIATKDPKRRGEVMQMLAAEYGDVGAAQLIRDYQMQNMGVGDPIVDPTTGEPQNVSLAEKLGDVPQGPAIPPEDLPDPATAVALQGLEPALRLTTNPLARGVRLLAGEDTPELIDSLASNDLGTLLQQTPSRSGLEGAARAVTGAVGEIGAMFIPGIGYVNPGFLLAKWGGKAIDPLAKRAGAAIGGGIPGAITRGGVHLSGALPGFVAPEVGLSAIEGLMTPGDASADILFAGPEFLSTAAAQNLPGVVKSAIDYFSDWNPEHLDILRENMTPLALLALPAVERTKTNGRIKQGIVRAATEEGSLGVEAFMKSLPPEIQQQFDAFAADYLASKQPEYEAGREALMQTLPKERQVVARFREQFGRDPTVAPRVERPPSETREEFYGERTRISEPFIPKGEPIDIPASNRDVRRDEVTIPESPGLEALARQAGAAGQQREEEPPRARALEYMATGEKPLQRVYTRDDVQSGIAAKALLDTNPELADKLASRPDGPSINDLKGIMAPGEKLKTLEERKAFAQSIRDEISFREQERQRTPEQLRAAVPPAGEAVQGAEPRDRMAIVNEAAEQAAQMGVLSPGERRRKQGPTAQQTGVTDYGTKDGLQEPPEAGQPVKDRGDGGRGDGGPQGQIAEVVERPAQEAGGQVESPSGVGGGTVATPPRPAPAPAPTPSPVTPEPQGVKPDVRQEEVPEQRPEAEKPRPPQGVPAGVGEQQGGGQRPAEARPDAGDAKPGVAPKPGDRQKVMGTDSIVESVNDYVGRRWEVYRSEDPNDPRGFVRSVDPDTGNVISLESFKTIKEARDHLDRARLLEELLGDNIRKGVVKDADKPEPEKPAEPKPAEAKEPEKSPVDSHRKLADDLKAAINRGEMIDTDNLFERANRAFGGTTAEGKYRSQDAYDALELAMNTFIREHPSWFDPHGSIDKAREIIGNLDTILGRFPPRARRSEEQKTHQQFSTPPHYAYLANWVANYRPGDHLLEPSAGTGSLATYGQNAGIERIVVNEIGKTRSAILDTMGFDKVYRENAEHLNALLKGKERPTVVVMNPPFSQTAGRMGDKMERTVGADHIEQALRLLEPNGRLVAIVGRGMAMDAPSWKGWWDRIQKEYNVRANIGVDGDVYKKYGTSFGTRLLVFDKNGPTKERPILGEVKDLRDALPLLEGVRNDRIDPVKRVGSEPDRPPEIKGGGAGAGQQQPVPAPTGDVAPEPTTPARPSSPGAIGGSRPAPVGHGGARPAAPHGGSIRVPGPSVPPAPGPTARPEPAGGGQPSARGDSRGADEQQPGVAGQSVPRPKVEIEESKHEAVSKHAGTFAKYKPQFVMEGTKAHPAPLEESAAMADVRMPKPDYRPNLPPEAIKSGMISTEQAEAVTHTGAQHQHFMPPDTEGNEYRKGFFIGDGTGTGKGNTNAAIIVDNWRQGRKKAVWVTEKKKLFDAHVGYWNAVGGEPEAMFLPPKAPGERITRPTGVAFTTYDTLAKGAGVPGKDRAQQLIDWLGKDFDGVIIFDEAHNMQNSMATKGDRGMVAASQKALAAVALDRAFPNARVAYASATGAASVHNLAYAHRLGLWGPGTAFANAQDFVAKIGAAGLASMEMVAQNMKQMGKYLSRQISFEGVEYAPVVHKMSKEQIEIYDEIADAWQLVLENIHAAIDDHTGGGKKQKTSAMGQFWASNQRFFQQVMIAMHMPSVIKEVEADIAKGRSPVMQLVNTNEAAQDRKLAQLEDVEAVEDMDLTPREILMGYVEKSFPVTQYEQYLDDQGNVQTRPVMDSQGNPVLNPEAVAMRDALLEKLGSLPVPENGLDQLIDHFGPDFFAEITGRKQRRQRKKDGSYGMVSRNDKMLAAEQKEFEDDKRKGLIFSQKGDTGANYHADLNIKNQRERAHYLLQSGWQVLRAIQGLGRTHRSNQKQPPLYRLVTNEDVPGWRRFTSTIARRLAEAGAITRGSREAAGSGIFSEADNLENKYAQRGLMRFVEDLHAGRIEGMTFAEFEKQIAMELTDKDGNLKMEKLNIKRFLNRVMSMRVAEQNKTIDAFGERVADQIILAKETGEYDRGLEQLEADKAQLIDERPVYRDPETKAETKISRVKIDNKTVPRTWESIAPKAEFFMRNARSGQLWAFVRGPEMTDPKTGSIGSSFYQMGVDSNRKQKMHANELYRRDNNGQLYWEDVSNVDAEPIWKRMVEEHPPYTTEHVSIIHGPILPIWDRLPNDSGNVRVVRVVTDDGKSILGRVIPESELAATMERLGAGAPDQAKLSSSEAVDAILAGKTLRLANNWHLKKSLVGGEDRIELVGPDQAQAKILKSRGVFSEIINYKTRYFVPTGTKGVSIVSDIIGQHPIAAMVGSKGSEAMRPLPTQHPGDPESPGMTMYGGLPLGQMLGWTVKKATERLGSAWNYMAPEWGVQSTKAASRLTEGGEAGRVSRLLQQQSDAEADYGGPLDLQLSDLLKGLSKTQRNNLMLSADKREKPMDAQVTDALGKYKQFEERKKKLAQAVDLRMNDGTPFTMLPDHMPQIWTDEAKRDVRRMKGEFWDKAVDVVVQTFDNKNLQFTGGETKKRTRTWTPDQVREQAVKWLEKTRLGLGESILDVDLYGDAPVPKVTSGSRTVGLHRLIQWPREFLEDDLGQSAVKHTKAFARRLAMAKVFGPKAQKLQGAMNDAIRAVEAEAKASGAEDIPQKIHFAKRFLETMVGRQLGIERLDPDTFGTGAAKRKLFRGATATSAALHLGPGAAFSSGLDLVWGSFMSAHEFGLLRTAYRTLKNAPIVLRDYPVVGRAVTGYKPLRRAIERGALDHQGVSHLIGEAAITPFFKSLISGFVGGHEALLRTTASEAGLAWAQRATKRLAKRYRKNPTLPPGDIILNTADARKLTDMGLTAGQVVDIAKRGSMNEAETRRVARGAVEITQFMARPIDLPIKWTSPAGRVFTQFWSMAYKQTQRSVGNTLKELGQGNISPLVRLIPLAIAAGWTADNWRNFLYGRDDDEDGKGKLAKLLGYMGSALGIIERPAQLIESGIPTADKIIRGITPVAVADAANIVVSASKVVRELMAKAAGEESNVPRALQGLARTSATGKTVEAELVRRTGMEPYSWKTKHRNAAYSPGAPKWYKTLNRLEKKLDAAKAEFEKTGTVAPENRVTAGELDLLRKMRSDRARIGKARGEYGKAGKADVFKDAERRYYDSEVARLKLAQ